MNTVIKLAEKILLMILTIIVLLLCLFQNSYALSINNSINSNPAIATTIHQSSSIYIAMDYKFSQHEANLENSTGINMDCCETVASCDHCVSCQLCHLYLDMTFNTFDNIGQFTKIISWSESWFSTIFSPETPPPRTL